VYPLVDIGNSFAHIFENGKIITLEHSQFLQQYARERLYYINVKQSLKDSLEAMQEWVDLEPFVALKDVYDGMGIDRQVLLLSRGDGIYIDAGSAITIDKLEYGRFCGGVILPGIWRQKQSYAEISSRLEIDALVRVEPNMLPKESTQETISYGIIAPIIALIEKINPNRLPLYFCGGDGALLASYFKDAIYDRELIFKGMKKVVKECRC